MSRLRKPYNVQEVTLTTGTADLVLGGAISGNRAFSAAVADGDRFTYKVQHESLNEWETGEGTYNQAANSIVRAGPIRAGSNGLSQVAFSTGNKAVTLVDDNYSATQIRTSTQYVGNESATPNADDNATFVSGPFSSSVGALRATQIGQNSNTDNAERSIAFGDGAVTTGAAFSVALGPDAETRAVGSAVPAESTAVGSYARAYLSGMNGFSAGRGYSTTDIFRLTTETIDAVPVVMGLDDGGADNDTFLEPVRDGRAKTLGFEILVTAQNQTDNDALFHRYSVLGHWNGTNFVQVGSPLTVGEINGPSMGTAAVAVSVANDRLEVSVTGIAAKTIRWAATVIASAIWHGGL